MGEGGGGRVGGREGGEGASSVSLYMMQQELDFLEV